MIEAILSLLVVPLFLIGAVVIGFGRQELSRLEQESPDLLRSVGIKHIDWWFGCLRGISRLAFLPIGKVLSAGSRFKLQLVVIIYMIAIMHVSLWLLVSIWITGAAIDWGELANLTCAAKRG